MRFSTTSLQLPVCFVAVVSFALLLPCVVAAEAPAIQAVDLGCEYKVNPLGIDSASPRLSWRLEGAARGIAQTAYQVRVAENESALRNGKSLVWDSGVVDSGDSVQVPYRGPAL